MKVNYENYIKNEGELWKAKL